MEGTPEAAAGPPQEFEVEEILRYRKNEDGAEYFLVKWVGYPVNQATWEPLEHMNDNCRELIAKARALFAWRRPGGQPAQVLSHAPLQIREEEVAADPSCAETLPEEVLVAEEAASPGPGDELAALGRISPVEGEEELDVDAGDVESTIITPAPYAEEPRVEAAKRPAGPHAADAAAGAAPASKRPRLPVPPPLPSQGPAGGQWGAAVPSQGKRLLPGPVSASNGAPRPPSTPPPPSAAPGRGRPEEPVRPKEMRCICGANEKLVNMRAPVAVCKLCHFALHPHCVEGALRTTPAPKDFVCPPCRLERVDEFHPPVGAGLLRHGYASSSSTFALTFNSQAAQWKKQQWAVHLRAVLLSAYDLSGPAWPHRVQGKLNGRQCVAIDPPKHLHVRREQCYNLTPLLKPGPNTLELKFTPRPDQPRNEPEESYCVGVVLTRPRSVASIIARIRTRSTETVASGRARVERLLKQVAQTEAGQDECRVTGNFGRTLKPLCPVSHCPIEEAAIGRACNHVQVFDLHSYIAVNQRMRSLDKRWTCPVCSLSLRPDEVNLDPFAQGVLDTIRGDEDLVEAIVFNEDCTWTTISAVKEDRDRQGEDEGGANGGAPPPALIDLSDSE